MLPDGIHFNVPDEEYRADPGYNQSTLVEFINARTPAHFKAEHEERKKKLEDADFIRIGKWIDDHLTSGDTSKYIVCPKEYPSTDKKGNVEMKEWTIRANYCKAWVEERKKEGMVIMEKDEIERASKCAEALKANVDFMDVLNNSHTQAVVICNHPVLGFRLKAKLDLLPKTMNEWAFDLKTGYSASRADVIRTCIKLRRDIQARFYMNCLKWADYGQYGNLSKFGFIVAETDAPYGVQFHYFVDGTLELNRAESDINAALVAYDNCFKSDVWPSYPNQWARITFPKWFGSTEDYDVLIGGE